MRDDAGMDELTVGQVAALVGISVRTLHHWDELGVVRPSFRSWSGYRLYSADDVARVYRVCLYRETGMPLARIAEILDDPGTDTTDHLAQQRELLLQRISHLHEMVRAVERLMKAEDNNMNLTPDQQRDILGQNWDPAWQSEAEERWGQTPEWAAAEAYKATMSADDWRQVRDETDAFERDAAAAMAAGVTPGSAAASELAERHRTLIGKWFEASHAKQVLIARGYVEDPRFREHYEAVAPGLAAWLKDIIDANAAANGVDPANAQWE
ncbi:MULTISPECIES: MerR family transcriptional regulator [unclassified Actinobaculum]|uniref:MerR family transcriptional regulator n=1 Tax=unclassified Actinobaculum TaxID=2609299 RepID=UPI000D5299EC|nr:MULTISPECIES: MerR family transcriptional regulator [unclassified Actinobaculum]AWE43207.1 MerR family transcriptional regulator [Actinobaculum sp. 313]RTE49893.1 MerR family transcriptional regulator [Actinobaculum sp. 352]